ncbi:MAG: HAMP domain-containing histidine kinase [candidate division WOR-3 bacterium]|nr:HAMP domain-containing histidine kinase [candidate division WOR-3 bacterium]MDH5684442.1 HAMP domain-containing histidine kinase [candidate division WOR-3 bacterium]
MDKRFRFSAKLLQGYFVFGAIILAGLWFFYSRVLLVRLEKETQVRSRIYAQYLSRIAEPSDAGSAELDIIFDEVIRKIDFPVIIADASGEPTNNFRNLEEKNPSPDRLKVLMQRLDNEHRPIYLTVASGDTLSIIHYGLSKAEKLLRIYPFFQLVLLFAFLLLGVWGILVYKRREQEQIWTALAKETAHQLATPISSLWGWLEVLKHERKETKPVDSVGRSEMNLTEVEEDLTRIREVSERFSRIGLPPKLQAQKIEDVVIKTISFIKHRAPKRIDFETLINANPLVKIDDVLISWTLENLIKNSIDAIGDDEGSIKVRTLVPADRKFLEIEITDNGVGISKERVSEIFKPGVTAKKYGWGVGLTLAKRIIEEYHKGKLILKESQPHRTVFSMLLPVVGDLK